MVDGSQVAMRVPFWDSFWQRAWDVIGSINWETVAAVVAALVASVALVYSVRAARRQNVLPVFLELIREFREPTFKSHVDYVLTKLEDRAPDASVGIKRLPKSAQQHVLPVQYYFNLLGQLRHSRFISAIEISSTMGGSVIETWRVLAPYVYAERATSGDTLYLGFYEDLAARITALGPIALRRKLNLATSPPPN